jgi:biotin carboxyl carrier protein
VEGRRWVPAGHWPVRAGTLNLSIQGKVEPVVYRYQIGNRSASVRVERENDGWRVAIDGRPSQFVRVAHSMTGSLDLDIDGRRCRVRLAQSGDKRFVALGSETIELKRLERTPARQERHDGGAAGGGLEAAMPGQVITVAVHEGEEVTRGQTLVVLEAMKMELRITAPHAGTVRRIHVQAGQVVERGQILAELQ